MSNLLMYLNKPEYWLQPKKILQRLGFRQTRESTATVALPWGLPIEVDPREAIGRAIVHHGLFDIGPVEAMFRLIDQGDTVLDIGANIGYMTSVAVSTHHNVSVISFEPHPSLFERLSRNRALWSAARPDLVGRLTLENLAISSKQGTATLLIPDVFESNQGISTLEPSRVEHEGKRIDVRTIRIDDYLRDLGRSIGLLKIDIEGHELAAIEGAKDVLGKRAIRDILFEDHAGFESEVCRLLQGYGYHVFFVGKLPWKPLICKPGNAAFAKAISFDTANYLATIDPQRAIARMQTYGYKCMGGRRKFASS